MRTMVCQGKQHLKKQLSFGLLHNDNVRFVHQQTVEKAPLVNREVDLILKDTKQKFDFRTRLFNKHSFCRIMYALICHLEHVH